MYFLFYHEYIEKSFYEFVEALSCRLRSRKMTAISCLAPSWVVILRLKGICHTIAADASLQSLRLSAWNLILFSTYKIIDFRLATLDILGLQRIIYS